VGKVRQRNQTSKMSKDLGRMEGDVEGEMVELRVAVAVVVVDVVVVVVVVVEVGGKKELCMGSWVGGVFGGWKVEEIRLCAFFCGASVCVVS
jgi:hypothetical protein